MAFNCFCTDAGERVSGFPSASRRLRAGIFSSASLNARTCAFVMLRTERSAPTTFSKRRRAVDHSSQVFAGG